MRRSSEGDMPSAVTIQTDDVTLQGEVYVPAGSRGLVVFAQSTGSGRHSPRNQFVAHQLRQAGLATMLFDLLSEEEEGLGEYNQAARYDIELLTDRLLAVTDWAQDQPDLRELPLGYLGASTGAAAALGAAAQRPEIVAAVVSRGGRPDLAHRYLSQVQAPTLLVVGGDDAQVLEYNRAAFGLIKAPKRLALVPGATHLFREPGAIEQVADMAGRWFCEYLTAARGRV